MAKSSVSSVLRIKCLLGIFGICAALENVLNVLCICVYGAFMKEIKINWKSNEIQQPGQTSSDWGIYGKAPFFLSNCKNSLFQTISLRQIWFHYVGFAGEANQSQESKENVQKPKRRTIDARVLKLNLASLTTLCTQSI